MGEQFNAIHMALIGHPALRGKILAWDYPSLSTIPPDLSSPGTQRWSIIDPEKLPSGIGAFENFKMSGTDIPKDGQQNQDFACSAFTSLPNGRLLVAGGTQKYPSHPHAPSHTGPTIGARLVFTFRPENWNTANPMWVEEDVLQAKRYYPSLILGESDNVYILRGHTDDSFDPPLIPDTFERWLAATGALDPNPPYSGPDTEFNNSVLLNYPRGHFLSNEQTFLCAYFPQAATVVDPANGWTDKGMAAHISRVYGASVLFPNIDPRHTDAVMMIGGLNLDLPNGVSEILGSVQICKASAGAAGSFDAPTQGWNWTPIEPMPGFWPDMIHDRAYLNAVLLPDSSVLVVGGSTALLGGSGPVLQVERFRGGQWQGLATMTTFRGYHQTALLLPSGKVLIAGGEGRGIDYEIYWPPYMFSSRPTWGSAPQENVTYGVVYTADIGTMPGGTALGKIVLMRPGAVTHHFDADQRYHELAFDLGENGDAFFAIPANKNALPPGYYMIWLVTNTGIPSAARWIHVQ